MGTLACKIGAITSDHPGTIDSTDPDGSRSPTGSAQVLLAWDRATTNADATQYRNPKTHRVLYGTSSGVYTGSIDMSLDTDPGMLERVIDNLVDGQDYYFVVRTVNSEGTESANSTEFLTSAAIPSSQSEPTWTDINSLPYNITAPGSYRLASSLTIASGAGITISSSDVVLFGGNSLWGYGTGRTLTYGTTGDSNAVLFGGVYDNVRICGFEFTSGAATPTTVNNGTAIYRGSTIGDNIEIDNNKFTLTGDNVAGIRFTSHTGANLRIHDNDVTLSGTGIKYFIHNQAGAKIYNNTLTSTDTTGYSGPYYHLSQSETWGDVFTFGGTGAQTQGFYNAGWGDNDCYHHGNTLTFTSERMRSFNPDGGSSGWVILHNTINANWLDGGESDNRCISMRFGSNNHIIGFNLINNQTPGAANGTVGVRFAGRDASGYPAPELVHHCWCYHNTVEADLPLEFYSSPSGYDPSGQYFYSWGNTWDGGAGFCLTAGGPNGVDDVYINGDTMTTTGTPVSCTAGANLRWDVCNSFSVGDVSGETSHITFNAPPCTYPATEDKIPSAPTNLRAL